MSVPVEEPGRSFSRFKSSAWEHDTARRRRHLAAAGHAANCTGRRLPVLSPPPDRQVRGYLVSHVGGIPMADLMPGDVQAMFTESPAEDNLAKPAEA